MFGLFRKKKTDSALDKMILAMYGDRPPPKTANIDEAVRLASEKLLMGAVDLAAVKRQAVDLAAGPIPYSTHDLAVSVALSFFKQPSLTPRLTNAQLYARMQVLEWTNEKKVVAILAMSFEQVLYKLYKPGMD